MNTVKNAAQRIEDAMTDYPSVASRTMTVTQAAEFVKKTGIRHLPVVDGGRVIGVVSERDLKQAELLSDAMSLLVNDVMTTEPYCVRVGTPLASVAREMAKSKYGCVVVLNDLNRVVGIFTTTDGMRVLSEILDGKGGVSLTMLGVERFLDSSYLT